MSPPGQSLAAPVARLAPFTGFNARRPPTHGAIARRRRLAATGKRLLPVVAVILLSVMVLWPELGREVDQASAAYRNARLIPDNGQLTQARYHGVSQRGEPYTVTAGTARQVGPDRIDMTDPKADLNQASGNWLMGQSRTGVYMQKSGQLDLSGDVTLYRDDGTTLVTDSATLDTKAGAAAGAEMTHAEGPFGTLDAQGFTATDGGAVIHFTGPGRLLLNGRHQ